MEIQSKASSKSSHMQEKNSVKKNKAKNTKKEQKDGEGQKVWYLAVLHHCWHILVLVTVLYVAGSTFKARNWTT